MSTAPALLPDGQVILSGKSRIVYLLNGAHLGGIGGQQAVLNAACSQDIDGGVAVQGTTVYLPCTSGIIAVRATQSPAALQLLWSSGTGGGPAIVAAGLVWTIGQGGVLYGLSPATGQVRQQVSIGTPANHFPTPTVADGLLLAPTADQGSRLHRVRLRRGRPADFGRQPGADDPGAGESSPASPPIAAPGGGGFPVGAFAGIVVAGL